MRVNRQPRFPPSEPLNTESLNTAAYGRSFIVPAKNNP